MTRPRQLVNKLDLDVSRHQSLLILQPIPWPHLYDLHLPRVVWQRLGPSDLGVAIVYHSYINLVSAMSQT